MAADTCRSLSCHHRRLQTIVPIAAGPEGMFRAGVEVVAALNGTGPGLGGSPTYELHKLAGTL